MTCARHGDYPRAVRRCHQFVVSFALAVACNRQPSAGEQAPPASEGPGEPEAPVEPAVAAPSSDVRLEITGAPEGATVLVRASDDRPPIVPARPLAGASSLALVPGFYEIVVAAGSDEQVIQLYAGPGASVRARWGEPESVVVEGATRIDRLAAEQVWEAEKQEIMAALGDWEGGELPAAARAVLDRRRSEIAALGDTPYAHMLRLRHAWLLAQITGPEDAWSVVAPVPVDSPAWAACSPWLLELLYFLKDFTGASARLQAVRARATDVGLVESFVSLDLLVAADEPDAQAESYRAATKIAGPPVVGEPMPRFELRELEKGEPIRSEALVGAPYLIEVWSTWCKPCVEAMKDLHALHERVAGEPPRLRIISVAINGTRAPIEQFRRERWPMPWTNAWVPDGEPLFKGWSFEGVPYAVLVGADGRVLAAGSHVSLDAVLEPSGEAR